MKAGTCDAADSLTGTAFLLLHAGGQRCALPAAAVREVTRALPLAFIPGAPAGVAGVVNLRGHLLTALDTAGLLGLPAMPVAGANVIVVQDGTFYSLLADKRGEMVQLPPEAFEPLPPDARLWAGAAAGICRSGDEILPLLDLGRICRRLNAETTGDAAREEMPYR